MEEVDQIVDKGAQLKEYAMDFIMTYGPKLVGAL